MPDALQARIRRAMIRVRRAGDDFTCLEEALTIYWMLRRRRLNPYVRIGVAKGQDGKLLGHAWVECDGHIVSIDTVSPAQFALLSAPNLEQRYAIHRGHLSV
jgi:hypothetical protein